MELQGALNSQNNLEKEPSQMTHLLNFKISYKTIVTKQCGIDIRIDIKTNGIELRAQK